MGLLTKNLPDGRLIQQVFTDIAEYGYWKKFDGLNLAKDNFELMFKSDAFPEYESAYLEEVLAQMKVSL